MYSPVALLLSHPALSTKESYVAEDAPMKKLPNTHKTKGNSSDTAHLITYIKRSVADALRLKFFFLRKSSLIFFYVFRFTLFFRKRFDLNQSFDFEDALLRPLPFPSSLDPLAFACQCKAYILGSRRSSA